MYADDDLSVIQAAVDAGGTVTFHATNRDGSPGVYFWDQALVVSNSATLTGPAPRGPRNVRAGWDDRRWGVQIVRQDCPYNDAAIFVDDPNNDDTVIIQNLSIDTDCHGVLQRGEAPPSGQDPYAFVPTLGSNLEIRDCRIVVGGVDASTATAGNRDIMSVFVGNASLVVTGCDLVSAATPDDGEPYTGDNDAIFSGLSAHDRIEVTDNISRCDSRSRYSLSAAMEAYLEHDPDCDILIADNYLESEGNVNVNTAAPARVIGNVMHSADNRLGMYIVGVDGGTIADNAISGSGIYGMILIGVTNTRYWGNDSSALETTNRQLTLDANSSGDLVTGNRFGPVHLMDGNAVVRIVGSDNSIGLNDYRGTDVPGWPDGTGCVSMTAESFGNTVFELSPSFPRGTTLCDQVQDLGDNTIVGWDQLCE